MTDDTAFQDLEISLLNISLESKSKNQIVEVGIFNNKRSRKTEEKLYGAFIRRPHSIRGADSKSWMIMPT